MVDCSFRHGIAINMLFDDFFVNFFIVSELYRNFQARTSKSRLNLVLMGVVADNFCFKQLNFIIATLMKGNMSEKE
jgi:hypothetical protein